MVQGNSLAKIFTKGATIESVSVPRELTGREIIEGNAQLRRAEVEAGTAHWAQLDEKRDIGRIILEEVTRTGELVPITPTRAEATL